MTCETNLDVNKFVDNFIDSVKSNFNTDQGLILTALGSYISVTNIPLKMAYWIALARNIEGGALSVALNKGSWGSWAGLAAAAISTGLSFTLAGALACKA